MNSFSINILLVCLANCYIVTGHPKPIDMQDERNQKHSLYEDNGGVMKNVYFYEGQLASLFKKNSKIKLLRGEEKNYYRIFLENIQPS